MVCSLLLLRSRRSAEFHTACNCAASHRSVDPSSVSTNRGRAFDWSDISLETLTQFIGARFVVESGDRKRCFHLKPCASWRFALFFL